MSERDKDEERTSKQGYAPPRPSVLPDNRRPSHGHQAACCTVYYRKPQAALTTRYRTAPPRTTHRPWTVAAKIMWWQILLATCQREQATERRTGDGRRTTHRLVRLSTSRRPLRAACCDAERDLRLISGVGRLQGAKVILTVYAMRSAHRSPGSGGQRQTHRGRPILFLHPRADDGQYHYNRFCVPAQATHRKA